MNRLLSLYAWLLLIVFGGIVLHAPLSVGFGVVFPEVQDFIKAWKEIVLAVASVMAIILVSQRKLWRELLDDWVIRLAGIYGILHLLLVPLLFQGVAATAAGLAIDLRYVVFFVLVYILMKLAPEYRRLMLIIGLAGAVIVATFATAQLFLPPDILTYIGYGPTTIAPFLTVDQNPDYIRISSTLRGPNPLGAYAAIILALLAAAILRGRVVLKDKVVIIATGLLTLMSSLALWHSYSRSAVVAAGIAVAIVLAVTILRKLSPRVWIIMCIVVFGLAGGLIANRESDFVSNVVLHENNDGGGAINSNEEHFNSLETGFERLVNQPFGAGIGSTGSASLYTERPNIIENQYLFTAHETGWIGLLLFLALFGLIMLRLWHRRADWLALGVFASGIGLALIGILLPVWADDTVALVWWGLAAIALGQRGVHERSTTN